MTNAEKCKYCGDDGECLVADTTKCNYQYIEYNDYGNFNFGIRPNINGVWCMAEKEVSDETCD